MVYPAGTEKSQPEGPPFQWEARLSPSNVGDKMKPHTEGIDFENQMLPRRNNTNDFKYNTHIKNTLVNRSR